VDAGFFDETWGWVPPNANQDDELPVAAAGNYRVYKWQAFPAGYMVDGYRLTINDGTFMGSSVHDSRKSGDAREWKGPPLVAGLRRLTITTWASRSGDGQTEWVHGFPEN